MENKVTKQRVSIQGKATSQSRTRLYLVWYQNKKRVWESTDEFYYTTPKGAFEKQHNKDVKLKLDALRNQRENEFFKGDIDEVLELKAAQSRDFHQYFEEYLQNYDKKDKRVMSAVLSLLKAFAPAPLPIKKVDETFCTKFKDYLETNLNGTSPTSYFARFKKFVAHCSRGKQKLFKQNPAAEVKMAKPQNVLLKDTLTIDELNALINAQCGNDEVKRAFLFACNTGLRFVDIKALKWQHVKAEAVEIVQAKTDVSVKIGINDNAQAFLPKRGNDDEAVFKLPSHNGTVKVLGYWAKRAGLDKHITFHCARHTFGTLLAYYQNDILTISKLLGHTSLTHTTKYVRVAEELKKKAVNSIPKLDTQNI
jgi:integrase/recombinase XerD